MNQIEKKKTQMKSKKEPKKERYSWEYKDSKRYYWRIEVEKGKEVKEDFEWEYTVFKSHSASDWEMVDEGIFLGQYDFPPSLCDILLHFTNYITSVALGMNKYSDLKPEN